MKSKQNKIYKKHLSRKTTKHNSRQKKNKKTKTNHSKKHSKKHSKNNNRNRRKQRQQGGSTNCDLASVKEPGFNIAGLGDIPGLSIPDSRGAIYRPNCKPDTYQAMTP